MSDRSRSLSSLLVAGFLGPHTLSHAPIRRDAEAELVSRPARSPPAALAICVAMHVGALAIAVEDHEKFSGVVHGLPGVGGHRAELGCLASFDDDLACTEQQPDSPV